MQIEQQTILNKAICQKKQLIKAHSYQTLKGQIYLGSLQAHCLCGRKFILKYKRSKLRIARLFHDFHPLRGDPIFLLEQQNQCKSNQKIQIDAKKFKQKIIQSNTYRKELRHLDLDHNSQYLRFYPHFISMWYRIIKSSDVRVQFYANLSDDFQFGSLLIPIRIDIFIKTKLYNENSYFAGTKYNQLLDGLTSQKARKKQLQQLKKNSKPLNSKKISKQQQRQAKQRDNQIRILTTNILQAEDIIRNQKLIRLFLIYLMQKMNLNIIKRCLIKPKSKNNYFIHQFKKQLIGLKVSQKHAKTKIKYNTGIQKIVRCHELQLLILDEVDYKNYYEQRLQHKKTLIYFKNWIKSQKQQIEKRKAVQIFQIKKIEMLQKKAPKLNTEVQIYQHSDSNFFMNDQQQQYRKKQEKKILQIFGDFSVDIEKINQFQISKQNKEIIQRFQQENKHFRCHANPKYLKSKLKYYQGQALQWMKYRQQKIGVKDLFEEEYLDNQQDYQFQRSLNPFWAQIQFINGNRVYLNYLTGQITQKFTEWQKVKGGILGDEMGLGKTVMSIALLADQNFQGTTIIIVPLNVINQWQQQFHKHCSKSIQIYMYHGNGVKRSVNLYQYDIVLTTYQTLANQYKTYSEYLELIQQKFLIKKKQKFNQHFIFEYQFRRIILDEAQNIKQSSTLQFAGARALKGQFRWCLTGTLVQNSQQDLFSILKFLNVETFSQNSWWNTYIKNAQTMAEKFNCIHTILRPILLRRTKDSTTSTGQQIVTLPQRIYEIIKPQFRQMEKEIYQQLQQGVRNYFLNLSVRQKSSYTHIFQIISRLRQFCCHPSLIFKKDLSQVRKNDVLKVLGDFLKQGTSAFRSGAISSLIQTQSQICSICFDSPYEQAVLTTCGHIYCQQCLKKWLARSSICSICRKQIKNTKYFRKKDIPDTKKQQKYSSLIQSDSSKLQAIIKVMLQVSKRKEKCVIFSQWLRVIQLLKKKLHQMKLNFCMITGQMNRNQRSKSIQAFKQNKNYPFILISLRAGGTGLNLTMANNVIVCDPWWNPAQQDQAINRVHRIGQTKQDSIEQKVEKMHQHKRKLADHILMKIDKDKQVQPNQTQQMIKMIIQ